MFDIHADRYKKWLSEEVTLSDPLAAVSLRSLVAHLFLGRNYRLLTERNTKEHLIATYIWIMDVVGRAREKFGATWKEDLLADLLRSRSSQGHDLALWLLGLVELYRHLAPLARIELLPLPETEEDMKQRVAELPDEVFTIPGSD